MQCNIGKADKVFRIIIGLVIIAIGLYFKSWWGAIGLVPLLTAITGWCPLYVPLGIKTCKTEAAQAPPPAAEVEQPPAEEETQPPAE